MSELNPALANAAHRIGVVHRAATLPLISVVIVNYQRWQDTSALVDQLLCEDALHRNEMEIIVVDNASAEYPAAQAVRRRPEVQVHCLPENRGFAAGVNHGFAHSSGEWLLVLNPDLLLCQGFTDLLCAAARELRTEHCGGKRVGVAGFRLRNRDGSHQHSVGFFPSLVAMVAGLLRSRRQRKYLVPTMTARQVVPWVTGCCLLVRRQCFEDLGGFDEHFFLYYEDVDLCRRAAQRGWAVCYEPIVQAVHLDPLQNRQSAPAPLWAITRHASLTYFRKHHAGWQYRGLSALVQAEAGLHSLLAFLRGRREELAMSRAVVGMCRDLNQARPRSARLRLQRVLQQARLQ